MKRQIFTLLIALFLATGTALIAQATNTQTIPPASQQVDQTGQPETGPGPDVDVDAGANAEDGLVDVEVNRNADSDTEAQGNDPAVQTGTNADLDADVNVDTDTDNLPETASGMPLVGLIGLLALAGAATLKAIR